MSRPAPGAAGPPTGAAISADALVQHYGAVRALDGLTLEVGAGEVFGILGPNGAGKTTAVEILEGYRRPDAGTARVLGLDPWRDGEQLRPRIGVMLQEGGLNPGLRPRELLRCFAAFYDAPEDPEALLDAVGLADAAATPVRRLSGGQAQRLSLACALVGRPEVLFLDEPTAGMDPHARAVTWDLVRAQQARGTTVVLTTHAMDEAETLCDRVAIVSAGRVAAIGSPRELTQAAVVAEVRFSAPPALDVTALGRALGLAAGGVREIRAGEYLVQAAGTPAVVAELALWLRDRDAPLGSLDTGRQSLERVFLQITAEDAATEVTSGPRP